jgi:hypothetical protein
LKIADREISRRDEVEKKLEYISQQLGQVEIIKQLPDIQNVQTDALVNRAMDVVSAALLFLAVHIRHESGRFGIIGTPKHSFI